MPPFDLYTQLLYTHFRGVHTNGTGRLAGTGRRVSGMEAEIWREPIGVDTGAVQ
jgi:hypothetical protein